MKLPEPAMKLHGKKNGKLTAESIDWYTAAQMREFYNAALEEAAKVCEVQVQMINVNGQNGRYKECAAAIRALKEVQVINDPAEICRVFELDDAEYPPPESGFAKL